MKWNEMHAGVHTAGLQFLHKLVPAKSQPFFVHPENVEMPRAGAIQKNGRNFQAGIVSKGTVVTIGDRLAPGPHGIALRELYQSDRRLQVGEIVFVAGLVHLVVPIPLAAVALPGVARDTVKPHHANAFCVLVIIGSHHATLAGGQGFRSVEAECRKVTDGSDRFIAVASGEGVRGIFNHAQVTGIGKFVDLLHIAGLTGQMNRHNRAGSRGDAAARIRNVQIHGERIDIHQYGARAEIGNRLRRGCKRGGGNQHFIPGLKTDAFVCKVKSRRAGGNRDGMARPGIAGELVLELHRFRSHGHPTATQHICNGLNFLIANTRTMERNLEIDALGAHRSSVTTKRLWEGTKTAAEIGIPDVCRWPAGFAGLYLLVFPATTRKRGPSMILAPESEYSTSERSE